MYRHNALQVLFRGAIFLKRPFLLTKSGSLAQRLLKGAVKTRTE